jgi:hypothetical protein
MNLRQLRLRDAAESFPNRKVSDSGENSFHRGKVEKGESRKTFPLSACVARVFIVRVIRVMNHRGIQTDDVDVEPHAALRQDCQPETGEL